MTGCFDIQVNGYAGVDFNDPLLTPDQFGLACEALQADGVSHFLPTVITGSPQQMTRCLVALRRCCSDVPLAQRMVAGFHIEGPFFPPQSGYIGAHPVEHARPADIDFTAQLLDAAGGMIKIFTLAPECDPDAVVTRFLSDQQVCVSAGHTNASLEQLRRAIDAGLRMFTHLGNGCPVELPRHDNIIQRALSLADKLHIGLIADGHHVPLFVLKNFLRTIPADRIVITTDAIAAAGLGPGTYRLGDRTIRVRAGDAPRVDESGQLAGSAATMPELRRNLAAIGCSDDLIRLYCCQNPKEALGFS